MFESCTHSLESSHHLRTVCAIVFCREWIVDLEVCEVTKGEQSLGARNARWVCWKVLNLSSGQTISGWALEYDVKLSKTSHRAQRGHHQVQWGQLISRLVNLAHIVVEECQVSKTVESGVPEAEKKCLQGDRCGECQVVLAVEVCVCFPVDLTVDTENVQSRPWDFALRGFGCCHAFRYGECSAWGHKEHVVDGVSQFRWKVRKTKVTFGVFDKSVKVVSMSPMESLDRTKT